jgi:phosphoribosylamine--glycine ligase
MRMDGDLLPWLAGVAAGAMPPGVPRARPGVAVCVVLAAGGYPGKPRAGDAITGLPPSSSDLVVFHAGTRRDGDGGSCTAGGRVLGVTARGADLDEARARAYGAIGRSVSRVCTSAETSACEDAKNMSDTKLDVAIMMGSKSDLETMQPAAKVLESWACRRGARASAHRTPGRAAAFVKDAGRRGAKAFICGAGGAAHLAGAVAAHTTRP